MIVRDRSWPHPVLASFKDDVMPNDFGFTVMWDADADNYYIDVKFQHQNKTLTEFLESGTAAYAVHVECRRNYYRRLYLLRQSHERLTIEGSQLLGRVEISGFVKVQKSVPDYQISGSHSDYGSATFRVEPGDVLAVAQTVTFDAFQDYDPLTRISSILTIRRSEEEVEGPMKIDMAGDRLVATLSQQDYDRYTDLKGDPDLGPLLANQVVVPVLMEATYEIRQIPVDERDLDMQKRWFRSIVKKLEDIEVDVYDQGIPLLDIVQRLLSLPLRRSLENLLRLTPMDEVT
jgi:hypothetical protein